MLPRRDARPRFSRPGAPGTRFPFTAFRDPAGRSSRRNGDYQSPNPFTDENVWRTPCRSAAKPCTTGVDDTAARSRTEPLSSERIFAASSAATACSTARAHDVVPFLLENSVLTAPCPQPIPRRQTRRSPRRPSRAVIVPSTCHDPRPWLGRRHTDHSDPDRVRNVRRTLCRSAASPPPSRPVDVTPEVPAAGLSAATAC